MLLGPVVGVFNEMGADGIEITHVDGETRVFASADVQRLDRSVLRRQWKRGMLVGAIPGVIMIGWGACCADDSPGIGGLPSEQGTSAFFGVLVGGLGRPPAPGVGAFVWRERWEPITGWTRSADPQQQQGGPLLGARFRF